MRALSSATSAQDVPTALCAFLGVLGACVRANMTKVAAEVTAAAKVGQDEREGSSRSAVRQAVAATQQRVLHDGFLGAYVPMLLRLAFPASESEQALLQGITRAWEAAVVTLGSYLEHSPAMAATHARKLLALVEGELFPLSVRAAAVRVWATTSTIATETQADGGYEELVGLHRICAIAQAASPVGQLCAEALCALVTRKRISTMRRPRRRLFTVF